MGGNTKFERNRQSYVIYIFSITCLLVVWENDENCMIA